MWSKKIWLHPIWFLYDSTRGEIILKHPWCKDKQVTCPHCGKILEVKNYRATCCNEEFRAGWYEIRQQKPVGTHNRRKGCGWASLPPYEKHSLIE